MRVFTLATTLAAVVSAQEQSEEMLRSLDGRIVAAAFNSRNVEVAKSGGNKLDLAFALALKSRMESDPENIPRHVKNQMIMGLAFNTIGDSPAELGMRSLYCDGDGTCAVPLTLKGIWGYGCWCNFDVEIMQGSGAPVNQFDGICMQLQKCLRCTAMDGEESGNTCNPRDLSTSYNADYSWNVVTQDIEADCTAQNPGDECGEHLCTCELGLIANVLNLLWDGAQYDFQYLHDNGFDPNVSCPSDPSFGRSNVECCGYYDAEPYRQPFNSDISSCCDQSQSLFTTATQECCTDGRIESIGSC